MKENIISIFMEDITNIRFETVEELYANKEKIRVKYQNLDNGVKEMYKWYFFYQLCIVKKLELKRLLWYYLNSDGNDLKLNKDLLFEYNKFCVEKERISKLNSKQMLVYEDGGFNLV